MTYNSEKDDLIIPEYGRHVQELIQHAKAIENPKERQAFTERVIDLMQQMQPQARNVEDYREKLWKHVFRIAEYDLDVDVPTGIDIDPEDAQKHPEKVPYPKFEASYRHYGHNVQQMIQKALSMPEGPKRDGFVATILSYMKLAYKTWNQEHYVSDDIIKGDLESLSNGQLKLDEEIAIDNLGQGPGSNRRRPMPQRNQNTGRGNYGNNRGRGSNRGNPGGGGGRRSPRR